MNRDKIFSNFWFGKKSIILKENVRFEIELPTPQFEVWTLNPNKEVHKGATMYYHYHFIKKKKGASKREDMCYTNMYIRI